MIIDYDKIRNEVKALGTIRDNESFLKAFLAAFSFPAATYNRLNTSAKKDINQGLHIQGNGGIFFLATSATSLSSEFNYLKKKDLSKIKEAFTIIVNETDLLGYDRDTGDVLETRKVDLYRYIEFFFPLLGIKQDSVSEEMKSADKKAAEKFAQLYNELNMINQNRSADISELLCRLLFCCFADSIGVLTNGGLRSLLFTYTNTSGSDTYSFLSKLFVAINTEQRNDIPGYFSNVRYIDSRLFTKELPPLSFNKTTRALILDLLSLDWSNINPDILGTLIQSIVRVLKAITASLLMEQVLAPNFNFKPKKPDDDESNDDERTIRIWGLREPSTQRVKNIVDSDLTELKASILQDPDITKSVNGVINPEVINKVLIPKIILTKYPELSTDEAEEVRQHVITDIVTRHAKVAQVGNRRFIDMSGKFINIEELNIDLIDSINPFQQAFEVLSKSITPKVLKSIQDCISAFKVSMTDDEAAFLWPKINEFAKVMRRPPSLDALDPHERRLAEALAYLKQVKRGMING